MNLPDFINGVFECFGSAFIFLHIIKLHRDKQVRGVSIIATIFFALWGFWNLYFYPHNGLTMSFIGGCFIVVANCIWIGQMFYYKNRL